MAYCSSPARGRKATDDLRQIQGLSTAVRAASKVVEASATAQTLTAQPMSMETLRQQHSEASEEALKSRLLVERSRDGSLLPPVLTRPDAAQLRGPQPRAEETRATNNPGIERWGKSMSEAGGMEDAVDGAMRTGLMVASRIGEQLARMREQEQRTIAAAEEQWARELQERFDAQLAPVSREDWLDKASPEMIERVHETATAWKASDPEAAQAAEKISEQVQSLYGIDVNNPGADEASVSAALVRAQQARLEIESERTKASAARADGVVAGAAMAGADRQDRADRNEPAWDTADRRLQLAESLEGKGDRETVNSRLLADKHPGAHPAGAVMQKPSGAATSMMAGKRSQDRISQRVGIEC